MLSIDLFDAEDDVVEAKNEEEENEAESWQG
jgi:hypothetical protein